jgi:hypothetical protein
MNYKLSNQAVGAIMMALQKSLMEQSDVVPVLRGFEVQPDDVNELVVVNPPIVKTSDQPKKESPVVKVTEKSYLGNNSKNLDEWDMP